MDYLQHKYKERDPLKTVDIVKKFFDDRGFTIQLFLKESEAKTFSCHLRLYYNNQFIAFANGKGTSKEYSLASGYAELFERFCNMSDPLWNPLLCKKIMQENFKKYGYYLSEGEVTLPIEEMYKEPLIDECLMDWFNQDRPAMENICKLIFGDKLYASPFTNVITNETEYFDRRVINKVNGSIGLSAGNSLEEAFNQGFSEILEAYVMEDSLCADQIVHHHVLKLENITDPVLRHMIDSILSKGYDLYMVDMSYEYNLPVIASILVNKQQHWIRINYGCFPVFEIAAERTITEMFQGADTYTLENSSIPIPHDFTDPYGLLVEHETSFSNVGYVPKGFFENLVYEDSYNKNCFLDKNSSNEQIFKYYQDLIKENELTVFYINNSLIPDMYALHIYCRELSVYSKLSHFFDIQHTRFNKVEDGLITYKKLQHIVENDEFEIKDIPNLLQQIVELNEYGVTGYYMSRDWVCPIPSLFKGALELPERLSHYEQSLNFGQDFGQLPYYDEISKYYMLIRYAKSKMTREDILFEISKIGYTNVTEEDLDNALSLSWILINGYIKPCWEFYHGEDFENIAKGYTK